MNVSNPLDHPCPHLATPQERDRDPRYGLCGGSAGQPCTWAKRYDGIADPLFHSERLELTCSFGVGQRRSPESLRDVILETGLV